MTNVKIVRTGGHITSVTCDGHTNYGVEGEDIVCSALSSIVQTALLGLMRVAGINVKIVRNDEQGFISFRIDSKLTEREVNDADAILETMLCGIVDLNEGFSDFIELEA